MPFRGYQIVSQSSGQWRRLRTSPAWGNPIPQSLPLRSRGRLSSNQPRGGYAKGSSLLGSWPGSVVNTPQKQRRKDSVCVLDSPTSGAGGGRVIVAVHSQRLREDSTHIHTHTQTHTHARTHARTHTHTRTHARTHARKHTRTHARTHAHTHTHNRYQGSLASPLLPVGCGG